ncbi:helix-turn-helix domain-containing protein [Anaerocolumna sp. MB42-C2]|uniref:helix-turn-helix domain-containing protein n=1 Tax=Anaerocolumna sp. MB42-C2 TaxID=3070997 RepID=UPI0027E16EE5|nr:helix-turn-helix transcriptional regulator [Anaerocolumna sp. MB42-C2]WMJ90274.1 helix-turn-helix transcriptional regulator [Anaerocolumna sp. MB42-C2]
MQIGEVIRENRKRKNMTQEEMANRLGVTAPAVNKWENGNSQPDIMLLAPIARLLGISLNTLLSFQEKLTADEINNFIYEAEAKLKTDGYDKVFLWARGITEQYPDCEQLIWQMAVVLDAWRLIKDIPNAEEYDNYINNCYVRALESQDENIRNRAADSLFGFYARKEQYERAEEYLNYFSRENPERKRKQAYIYSKTERVNQAYKEYEELLFSGYQMMSMVFGSIYILVMQDNDKEKAYSLAVKQKQLAEVFEMGEYHENSSMLEWVTSVKDVDKTIDTMEQMLNNIDKICDFTKSALYEHMNFKEVSRDFGNELHENLLNCFQNEETYGYMKDNLRWQKLVEHGIKK